MSKKSEIKCTICHCLIEREEEQKWACDDANHPGVLGPCHEKCYERVCKEQPDLPWKDLISGEIDYEGMAEDLGVEDPEGEWDEHDCN